MKKQFIELTNEDIEIIKNVEKITNTDYGIKKNKIEAWGLLSALYELTNYHNYLIEEKEIEEEMRSLR